jgi:wyosine [tRNA(Phe)-imidazoG37] synthetase (radical SAM superfamily)
MQLQRTFVYGPLHSRRLGRSLGINVLPTAFKTCNFNCAYCQYGGTATPKKVAWPEPGAIVADLDRALASRTPVDHITVAGNGEPTLHPAFSRIVDGLIDVRNRRAPATPLAILSNGSTLNRSDVRQAVARFDERHMKLDAGDATTLLRINACPISLGRLIAGLRDLGNVVVQSMFVRDARGHVDNTTPEAVSAWIGALRRVKPAAVHIYSLDRKPALTSLAPVNRNDLETIAMQVEGAGLKASVFV